MTRARQIPLGLSHQAEYGRDSFVAGEPNSAALALIERWPDWAQPVLFLSGPHGSGKTHLAHVWAGLSGAAFLAAHDAEALRAAKGLGSGAAVVEDLDRQPLDESALFHFLNAAREARATVLLTSRLSAAHLPVRLPDLRSRLRLAAPATLSPPDGTLLRILLVKLFSDRQLGVDKAVVDFLLARMERSFAAALRLVDELDREALASSQGVTRPMAGKVLAAIAEEAPRFTDLE